MPTIGPLACSSSNRIIALPLFSARFNILALWRGEGESLFRIEAATREELTLFPVARVPLSVKAGDHDDAGFLNQKENPVGEPAQPCTSPVFIDYRKAERLR